MYKRSVVRLISVFVCLSLLGCAVAPMPVVITKESEAEGYYNGQIQGAEDATASGAWALAGMFLGPIGVATAYVWDHQPPTEGLAGRPPEYVAGYTQTYQSTKARRAGLCAFIGWLTWIPLYLINT